MVESNYSSVQEAERKAVLERKVKSGTITPDEKNELATINQTDKARDQAVKAVCTDGNKGGSGCGVLVGPAQEALKKYGENVTYSLLYKDLYPQDAKNLESVLQGLDAGSIGRDQAITAIAQASGVSWETAAGRYDTAMQAQALTAALAGVAGLKGATEKPAGSGSVKTTQSSQIIKSYGPHELGPLGNPNDSRALASTFGSGTYTEKVAETDIYLYRDYGGKAKADGRFWPPEPSKGPLQSQMDSAILPEWGNTFQNQAIIKIPKGTKYYEGPAAAQTGTKGTHPTLQGGGTQIFLPTPKNEWIIKK